MIEDFLLDFLIGNCSINVEFLENKKRKNTAGAYLLSITEIKKISAPQLAAGAPLIVNNYILGEMI